MVDGIFRMVRRGRLGELTSRYPDTVNVGGLMVRWAEPIIVALRTPSTHWPFRRLRRKVFSVNHQPTRSCRHCLQGGIFHPLGLVMMNKAGFHHATAACPALENFQPKRFRLKISTPGQLAAIVDPRALANEKQWATRGHAKRPEWRVRIGPPKRDQTAMVGSLSSKGGGAGEASSNGIA